MNRRTKQMQLHLRTCFISNLLVFAFTGNPSMLVLVNSSASLLYQVTSLRCFHRALRSHLLTDCLCDSSSSTAFHVSIGALTVQLQNSRKAKPSRVPLLEDGLRHDSARTQLPHGSAWLQCSVQVTCDANMRSTRWKPKGDATLRCKVYNARAIKLKDAEQRMWMPVERAIARQMCRDVG